MERMDVLKHYRNFEVPDGEDDYQYVNWFEWKKNVLSHPAIRDTLQPKDKLIEVYANYANGTIRSGHYYTYFADKDKAPEWLKTNDLVETEQPYPDTDDLEMKEWGDVRDRGPDD